MRPGHQRSCPSALVAGQLRRDAVRQLWERCCGAAASQAGGTAAPGSAARRVRPAQPRSGATHSFPLGENESRNQPMLPSVSAKMFRMRCSPPELASPAHSTSWL
ncbi:unnamed protein product [Coccothraustes coccothraustes]